MVFDIINQVVEFYRENKEVIDPLVIPGELALYTLGVLMCGNRKNEEKRENGEARHSLEGYTGEHMARTRGKYFYDTD